MPMPSLVISRCRADWATVCLLWRECTQTAVGCKVIPPPRLAARESAQVARVVVFCRLQPTLQGRFAEATASGLAPVGQSARQWRLKGGLRSMQDTILQSVGRTPLVRLRRVTEGLQATVCI